MKKLKKALQSNYLYYLLLILSLATLLVRINIPNRSIYNENSKYVYGYVTEYKIKDKKMTIYLKSKENIVINTNKIINISYGDYIKVKGTFSKPSPNTNFNLFNYKKYLLSKKINYIVKADKLIIVKKNNNILYKIKNNLNKRIDKCKYSKGYIKTFLFADKSDIEEMQSNYQKLGISHLMAVSGMHVTLVSLILLKMLSKVKRKYLIISIVLIIYMFLTNFTISMVRATLQFILFSINKKLHIKNINIIILLFSVLLIYNSYNIYNIGFIFSFTISFTLIRFSKNISKENILIKSLKLSLVSYLSSLPILINNFYKINLLSIILNIIYIPYVTYILFPSTLLTLIFPKLDKINYSFVNIFESVSKALSNINILNIPVSKLPIIIIVIYYLILYTLLDKYNIKKLMIFITILLVILFYKSYVFNPSITFINVGQGDSALIKTKNKNILIDTGGNINYDLTNKVLVPYLNSEGVKKIDYLILTHGDFDHMGEAINLIKQIKVKNIIFNCGEYNDLEKELKNKRIKSYTCVDRIDDIYFLQTKEYDNENDNSNIIYMKINKYKFLFMGDASIKKEKDIIKKYNISNIDVLKVGHHGSNTSTSKEFINKIRPKYSIISVGKYNKYGHPNKEVLDNLNKSKIYRTDQNGSIKISVKNKLQIKVCIP